MISKLNDGRDMVLDLREKIFGLRAVNDVGNADAMGSCEKDLA